MALNVVLLVACILIGLGSVIYFFFWNRFFAFILGFLVRLALWTRSSSATWVGFGSVHLSLIAGRIIIRDLRYHSSNQTFRIVKCQFSWRWWVRKAAEEEDISEAISDEEVGITRQSSALKCRIHVAVEGFEWFMYNRTASFDSILSQLAAADPALAPLLSKGRESSSQLDDPSPLDRHRSRNTLYSSGRNALSSVRIPPYVQSRLEKIRQQLPDLNPKNLLPLSFEATKGAITMGNHTVENLFMGEFARVSGTFSHVQSRSKYDHYKQLLRLTFNDVTISCIENPDYWESGLKIGEDVRRALTKTESVFDRAPLPLLYNLFNTAWIRVRVHFPYFKSRSRRYRKPEKNKEQKWASWSKKKQEEVNHVGADFSKLEYAIDRKLLETPVLELTYHVDVAGSVPDSVAGGFDDRQKGSNVGGLEYLDIGNGDLPPEWAVEVVVQGGSIHYGPWADRQRTQLQRIFFPQAFTHGSSTKRLEPGQTRCCTCLKLLFEFQDVTSLTLPFREASKNWQWDGLAGIPRDAKQREAGALQIRIGNKSFVKYFVPMVALENSYDAELSIFMDSVSVTSSLNDIRLLEAKSCKIYSGLSSPLQWDRHRIWDFRVDFSQPVLNLIRDHINMLTDLGKDWSSGPPSDFYTFIPITYGVHLCFSKYEINLYANDHNIIDRPLEKRENVMVSLKSNTLLSNVKIPSDRFRPLSTTVTFSVETPNLHLLLSLPRWNTHALSPSSLNHVSNIGHLSAFSLSGEYTYHAEIREDCIDQLKLHIKIPSPAFKLYGWLIRHVMVLRENYFGTFTQYSTTREYLDKLGRNKPVGDPLDLKYRPGKNNVFHLNLSLLAENATVVLPAGLLGYERDRSITSDVDMGQCILLDIPDLQLQLRLHDYSMEMSLNIDPICISVEGSYFDSQLFSHRHGAQLSKRKLYLGGLDITANRLFGPQPHASTYVCVWNICVGRVKGFFSTHEGQILALALRSFMHTFNDPFNAPAEEFQPTTFRDATFLKVKVDEADLTWQATAASVRANFPDGLSFSFNNIARMSHRKLTSLAVPAIEVQLLLPPTTGKQWLEVCRLRTTIYLDLYKATKGWRSDAVIQREFITVQDKPTQRFADMGSPEKRSTEHRGLLYLTPVSAPRSHPQGGRRRPSKRLSAKPTVGAIQETLPESESDPEQFVSEIERDQMLANSRPESSAYLQYELDGNSTSSMDESDELGSNSEDNWSVYSGIGDETSKMNVRAPYWSLCRRFRLLHSPSESKFEPTFTSDVKDVPTWHRLRPEDSGSESVDDNGQKSQEWYSPRHSDDIDRKYIHLALSDTLLFGTPLALECFGGLISEYRDKLTSPELQLDSLILDWMAAAPGTPKSASITTIHIILSNQQGSFAQDVINSSKLNGFSNESVVFSQALIKSVELFAELPSTDNEDIPKLVQPCASLHMRRIDASIRSLASVSMARPRRPSASMTAAVEYHCDEMSSILSSSKLDFSTGSSHIHLHHDSAETILLLGMSIRRPLMDVFDAVKSSKRLSKLGRQHLLLSLLRVAGPSMSKDLLSSVQPAFFVQRGRPRQLRQDKSWKLLFHLRHSLSDLQEYTHSELARSLRHFPGLWTPNQSERNQSELQKLDEIPIDTSVEIVAQTFQTPAAKTQTSIFESGKAGPKAIAVHCATIHVLLGDISPESTVVIKGLDIRGDLLTCPLLSESQTITSYQVAPKSIRPASNFDHCNIGLSLGIDSLQTTVYPTLFAFLQNAIHVWKLVPASSNSTERERQEGFGLSPSSDNSNQNKIFVCSMHIIVAHALIEAAAENVVFGIATEQFSSSGLVHIPKSAAIYNNRFISGHQTVRFDDLILRVRARTMSDTRQDNKDTLAEANITRNVISILFQSNVLQGTSIRSTIGIDTVEFNFPRSALRLYHFFEQWRQDYLPGIEDTVRSLFAEIRQNPKNTTSKGRSKERHWELLLGLNISVSNIAVVMQVMHGTWLVWTAHEVGAYLKNKLGEKNFTRRAGLQVTSQSIKIMSSSPTQKANQITDRMPKIILNLPSVSASVTISAKQSDVLVSVGFLRVAIKPSHWDALLSVQQKFGQDFNDLLLIISETQRKRPAENATKSKQKSAFLRVAGKCDGFKIGLEGPSSIQFLECTDINASFNTSGPLHYQFTLNGLSLYLTSKAVAKKNVNPDRSQLPVMVSVDLKVSGHRGVSSKKQHARVIMNITKFHAILQTHLVGDIGDFIDHLQAEVLLRKEQRSLELNEFKTKAQRVMSTFNLNPKTANLANDTSFMRNQSFIVSMTNFGLAFPLSQSKRQAQRPWTDGNSVTQALLITVSSLEFETQRGESGEAHMKDFCAQFLARFNPSDGKDFSAKRHQTSNQMLYPQMTAKLNSRSTSSSRQISISATISGFVLDLDPSVTGYAFSLVDAYRQGKQRMEQLASGLPRNAPEQDALTPATESGFAEESQTNRRVTTALEVSMNFQSGTVRMHPRTKDSFLLGVGHSDWRHRTARVTETDAEMFFLPELTVWCEYRAKQSEAGSSADSPVLLFKSTVHSSSNTFRPSLLPFITGIVHNIEERMKRVSHNIDHQQHRSSFMQRSLSSASGDESSTMIIRMSQPASSALQIIFSLRIDKSRLEFTCKPDVNVVAGLNWESGGFVFNMSPARGASISASISGLTASLKHGFLSSNSAHVDARNLNVSVDFAKRCLQSGLFINTVSIVVDTEFSGGFKFSRLQDFLCLKAVWLDHIPVYKRDVTEKPNSPNTLSPLSPIGQSPKQGFDTSILLRVRRITFEADLGQSISVISFALQTALIRTRLTSELSEIAFAIESVEMLAKGNLSGSLRMPDFLIRTVRRRMQLQYEMQPHSRMLELTLTTGPFDIQLQSDWLWLLQYRAEPLEAMIHDDWTKMQGSVEDSDRQLQLFFSVTGRKVIAMMTIMALPKLVMYAGKLGASLEEQREGASRESSAFRSSRLPKPDNALSEVANAMLKSARGKLKESDTLTYMISQHMELKLEELVFIVLPRSQNDTELARFIGRDVSAQLERVVQRGTYPIQRILELSLSRMAISQLLRHHPHTRLPLQETDVLAAVENNFAGTENIIFSLPSMNMRMTSDEDLKEGLRLLPYDFDSTFVRREGHINMENINITFNLSLYSWLTNLRKTFTRELKRAQDISEWRVGNATSALTGRPRQGSTDLTSSPVSADNDQPQSPPRSRSSSHSRPSTPQRSRSVESVILGQAVWGQFPRSPAMQTKSATVDTTRVSDELSASTPFLTRTPSAAGKPSEKTNVAEAPPKKSLDLVFRPRSRKIERLTVRQLGEATPDVMHPFFTKKAGFNLEESLPQYVHEYATAPIEEIMKGLLKLYSKQLS